MKKRKDRTWVIIVVILGVFMMMGALGLVALRVSGGSFAAAPRIGGGNVGVIYVYGIIAAGGGGAGLFGDVSSGAEEVLRQIEQAREDDSTPAIVIRINSPGGSAAAAQEIYREIRRLAERKRVVTSMGDVAASGGYYVACAANRIVASPATLTGSIGVIMETENLEKLFEKIGLKIETIKSGPHKDIGSFSRPLTEEERRILQSLIDDVYDQFVTDVAVGRGLKKERVRAIADGSIFTGKQARKLGLVDELGNFHQAVRLAARMARIRGKPRLVFYERTSFMDMLMRGAASEMGKSLGSQLAESVKGDPLQLLRHPGL